MKEYKFRAWNKENDEMHYFLPLSVMAHRIYDGERSWDDYSNYQIGSEVIENPQGYFDSAVEIFNEKKDPFIIMQFTGLRDKNGKEIYESDILEFQNEEADHTPIEVIWEEQFELLDDEWFDGEKYTNVEVIGNIFENPDLVKK